MNLKYKFTCGCVVPAEAVEYKYRYKGSGSSKFAHCPEHDDEKLDLKLWLCKSGCGSWDEYSKMVNSQPVCLKCRSAHHLARNRAAKQKLKELGHRQRYNVLPKKLTGEKKAEPDRLAFLDRGPRIPTIEDYPVLARLSQNVGNKQ